jgi:Ras-related protein Rab-2A
MYQYLFKFIIVGDSNVGKSCLLLRYINNYFNDKKDSTVGVEFGYKLIEINDKNNNIIPIKLHIWDTAGQESFKSITRSYYRGSAGVILVYDITVRESFINIISWLNEIKIHNTNNDPVIALIGNKIDLNKNRKVSTQEGRTLSQLYNLLFFEISIKEDLNIDYIFSDITYKIYNKIITTDIDYTNNIHGIKLGLSNTDEKKICC